MRIAGPVMPSVDPNVRARCVTRALSSCVTTEAGLKILYISHYFPPEMGAPAARVSELSKHWLRSGHSVEVLTGFPNQPTGEVPKQYKAKLWRLILRERLDGVTVVRTWLLPLPNRKP